MKIFLRLASVTVVLLASLLLAVPNAAADSSRAVVKGDYGQRVIVSETRNLDPTGQRVVVRGRQFNPRVGVYVALCLKPDEGDAPSPCGGWPARAAMPLGAAASPSSGAGSGAVRCMTAVG